MVRTLTVCLICLAAPLGAAQAGTLMAGQAKTTPIADCYANVRYDVVDGAHQVVTTIAPGPDASGHPMRFTSRLANGESQDISVGGYGENAILTTLTVRRTGDLVSFAVASKPVSWQRNVAAASTDQADRGKARQD
jgi:hypothetical protein